MVRAPKTAVLQILDVLVGNALMHGAGSVTVTARRIGAGVAIDVHDEGTGFDAAAVAGRSDPGVGHGLSLARSLAQLAGGSLVLGPEVRLLLPASRSAPAPVVHGSTS